MSIIKIHKVDPKDPQHTLCMKPINVVLTTNDALDKTKPWDVTCSNCLHVIEQGQKK